MPRGSRVQVSDYERRRWVEEMEQGKGITAISRAAGRDIRVVKRHIALAEEERELARARHDFIRSRLELHQEDLLEDCRRIRSIVVSGRAEPLQPSTYPQDKIHIGLLGHIRRLRLGSLLAEREGRATTYMTDLGDLTGKLVAKETKLKTDLTGIRTHEWTGDLIAEQESGLWRGAVSDRTYSSYQQPDKPGVHLMWGTDTYLTLSPIDQELLSAVEQAHKEIRSLTTELAATLRPTIEHLKILADLIVDELDIFLLRRIVRGQCKLCPA